MDKPQPPQVVAVTSGFIKISQLVFVTANGETVGPNDENAIIGKGGFGKCLVYITQTRLFFFIFENTIKLSRCCSKGQI